jgi:hypothetical protein
LDNLHCFFFLLNSKKIHDWKKNKKKTHTPTTPNTKTQHNCYSNSDPPSLFMGIFTRLFVVGFALFLAEL